VINNAGDHKQRALVQGVREQECHRRRDGQRRAQANQHGQGAKCHHSGIGQHFFDAGAAQCQPDTDKEGDGADAAQHSQPQLGAT